MSLFVIQYSRPTGSFFPLLFSLPPSFSSSTPWQQKEILVIFFFFSPCLSLGRKRQRMIQRLSCSWKQRSREALHRSQPSALERLHGRMGGWVGGDSGGFGGWWAWEATESMKGTWCMDSDGRVSENSPQTQESSPLLYKSLWCASSEITPHQGWRWPCVPSPGGPTPGRLTHERTPLHSFSSYFPFPPRCPGGKNVNMNGY